MKTVVLLLPIMLLFAVNGHADSVYLKDGKIAHGIITEETTTTILLESNDAWQKIDKSAIEFIRKGERPAIEPSGVRVIATGEGTAGQQRTRWGTLETVLKLGADVGGRNAYSNVKVTGAHAFNGAGSSVGAGASLTAEEILYVLPTIGIGGGISYQTPRKVSDSGGKFSFIPIYALLRVRTTPSAANRYAYATAQFGYNYFIADQSYVGAGNYSMTNGSYAGVGGGYVFGRMQAELLYTIDRGRMSGSDYDAVNGAYSISADTSYSKISLSLGYLF